MTSDAHFWAIIAHADQKKSLSPAQRGRVRELLEESSARYLQTAGEGVGEAYDRLSRVADYLCAALAALLCREWSFADDDEFAPFRDEGEALSWLSGKAPNTSAADPEELLANTKIWTLRTMWLLLEDINRQLSNIDAWERGISKWHWSSPLATPSRLPLELQEFIFDLCQIWHDHVDSRLRLPRRDPEPDNPLLRFIDEALASVVGDQRPEKKTILQIVQRFIRPAIFEQAAADADRASEMEEHEVDSNPFGGNEKVHGD